MIKKVISLLVISTLVFSLSVFVPLVHSTYWLQFHYDERHTGYSPTDFFSTPASVENWSIPQVPGVNYVSPVVIKDKVFFSSLNGYVYCFDTETKEKKWQKSTGCPVYATPAGITFNGSMYVFIGTTDGKIYGIDATGSTLSNLIVKSIYTVDSGIYAGLTIALISAGQVYLYVATNSGDVYCLNIANISSGVMNLVWKRSLGSYLWSSPAVDAARTTVYVGTYNGKVYALNALTGTINWEYQQSGGPIRTSPAIGSDGTIYIGSSDYKVHAINPDGTNKWQYQTKDAIFSSPAIAGSTVYVGSNDRKIYALTTISGTASWEYTTSSGVYSSPAVVDNLVCVGSNDKKMYVLNSTNGNLIWNYTVGGSIESSPAISEHKCYFSSEDGNPRSLTAGGNWGFASGDLSYWTTWGQVDGIQTDGYYGFTSHDGDGKFLGTSAQYQTKNGGVYQRITTPIGRRYKASCYIRTYQNGGANWDTLCRIGIDPAGGTNPSGNIEWSGWMDSVGAWYYLEVSAITTGTSATVFLEQWHKYALERNVTCFDEVKFVPVDTTPPAAVNDLSGQPGPTGGTVTLNWTTPGDDGNTGTATEYDIRYSLSSITESNWNSATQLTGEPVPSGAGIPQSWAVGGFTPGTTYYFALKTRDEVSNWSGISNVAQTYANPWISGGNWGFASGDLSYWTTWGQVDGIQTDGYYGFTSHDGDGKFLGTSAQYQTKNGGVYQRISAISGRQYKASCQIRTYQNGGQNWDTVCRVGISPSGGTDPQIGVTWSGWMDSVGAWYYLETPAVTATASAVTIFLEQWHKWALERNVTCFDQAQIVDLGGGGAAPRLSLDPRMAILSDTEATEFRLRDSYVSPNPSMVEGTGQVYASLPGGGRGAPSRSGGIRLAMFVGLADKVKARVYTVAGELVYEGELDGNDYTIIQGANNKPGIAYVINWSGINQEGTKVIPGVYICIMDAEKRGYQSLRKSSKLAIVR